MRKEVLILFLILALATFFRFWQLDSIPPGLYPDVAINGVNALDALKTQDYKVFYPDNNGREGLFMNLIAFSFAIFGPSVWAMKVVAAIFGTLTVLGVYLLAREIFRGLGVSDFLRRHSENIALFSAFFTAISFWHVNFSRIGFRAIMVPFFSVFAFYFLFKALENLRVNKAVCLPCLVLAGFSFGLGFQTYISFRVAPLILAVAAIPLFLFFRRENLQKKFLVLSSFFLFFTFLAALPIGLYFLQNPADFMGRAAGVSIFQATEPVKALLTSFGAHLAMFNFIGDFNWRHNISGAPLLFWPVGILFLIGLASSVRTLIRNYQEKNWTGDIGYWFLLSFWFVMLLPGILTIEAVPHALRAIGAIPATFIFAGLGAAILFEKFWAFVSQKRFFDASLLKAAFAVFIFSFIMASYSIYFTVWAKNPEVQGAFSTNLFEIGQYLNSLPADKKSYVIVNLDGVLVNGLPMPAQTPIFVERAKFGEPRAVYVLPANLARIQAEANKTVIIPLKPDDAIFESLKQAFPQGQVIEQGVKRMVI